MTPDQKAEMLGLLTARELYEELMGRFDHAIFSGIRHQPETEDLKMNVSSRRYRGDMYVCQGLAADLIAACQKTRDEGIVEISPDDL